MEKNFIFTIRKLQLLLNVKFFQKNINKDSFID
jgi:hypothetical protein